MTEPESDELSLRRQGDGAPAPRTNELALVALILGLAGIVPVLGLLPSLVGLFAGLVARRRIRRSGGREKGSGCAAAGVVLSGLFLVINAAVLLLLVMAIVTEVIEKQQDAACRSNLKQIGMWMHLYAADHDEAFPESFSRLIPEYVADPSLFVCPHAAGAATVNAQNVDRTGSFVLVRDARRSSAPPNLVLAHEGQPGGDGSVYVLLVDGRVERMAIDLLQRRLQKQKGGEADAFGW